MGTRGPKPLPDHLRRSHRIGVCLNKIELGELERRLGQPGLADLVMHGGKNARKGLKCASEYMRLLALGRPGRLIVPQINRQAYAEFVRVGANVNQIAAGIINSLYDSSDRDMITAILSDLLELSQVLLGIKFQAAELNDESFIFID